MNLLTAVEEDKKDPAGIFGDFISSIKYEHIPEDVIDLLKQRVLDTLACMIAGSNEGGIAEVVDYVTECGGNSESTVIVYGNKVNAAMAAFANGPMARALDMGDLHPEGQHLSEFIIPVLFSLAEAEGGVNGKDFLSAYCVGGEIQSRIGNACFGLSELSVYQKSVNYTQWGALCAGAKLLRFNAGISWSAIGIAFAVPSSTDFQSVAEGNQMVRMKHAFTCADVIHCLALARRGIIGTKNVFLGPRGYLATHYPKKNDPNRLIDGLGTTWEWRNTSTKGYACCYAAHAPITGALNLIKQHKLNPHSIQNIECELHPMAIALVAEPKILKWNPTSSTEAQFSLPFCLATAILNGQVLPVDCSIERLENQDLRDLMSLITVKQGSSAKSLFSTVICITTKDGMKYEQSVSQPYGSPENPLGWEGEIDKFRNCAALASRVIPKSSVDKVIDMCRNLENIDDVTSIVRLLSNR